MPKVKNLPYTPVTIYGKENICKICGIQPAMTDVDYSRKFNNFKLRRAKIPKIVLYGSKPVKERICFFCDRERRRIEFSTTVATKRKGEQS